jgi:hypothetical protein
MNYRNKNTDNPYRNQYLPAQPQDSTIKNFMSPAPITLAIQNGSKTVMTKRIQSNYLPNNPQWEIEKISAWENTPRIPPIRISQLGILR